ncbi:MULTISPECIES: hypothetical protein [unclassified Pseudomonas]|uniref:hypothetical protein n=1 Tax=unclassified Pseudomonas TaxID=196821 RepID=UPI000BC3B745|nr:MULTISPECIES: hypothetical protein [unclassified Pseudomonas]PVZ15350.1 hypothetical protein F474_02125 [Pseudomonas sp. URIL14HWK12:I12]PVZ24724.1 hypothetical protein F470_01780 [Pseudomonas sp. URIL14HWK12:I10]PVZ34569.1 hypothetical protein F472_02125 [Pseudomonas sp. URIL14HWK12:I11]SNZ08682.1 hypothetical protein SAMN05660463_01113 [Pseudomonas sp. URIL14HWK12:I9]
MIEQRLELRRFLRRHFAVFAVMYVAGVLSLVSANFLLGLLHAPRNELAAPFFTLMGCALAWSLATFAMIRGFRWGTQALVTLLLFSGGANLIAWWQAGSGLEQKMAMGGLALALLGLLAVNSRRHREMRQRLRDYRAMRQTRAQRMRSHTR